MERMDILALLTAIKVATGPFVCKIAVMISCIPIDCRAGTASYFCRAMWGIDRYKQLPNRFYETGPVKMPCKFVFALLLKISALGNASCKLKCHYTIL